MKELVELFTNNGTAIVCLVYFMWYNNNTMKEFTNQMNAMNDNLIKLIERIDSK